MSYKKDKKILFACDRILDNYVDEMRKGFENQGYDVTFIDKNGLILDRKNKLKIKIIKYLNLEKILKKSMNNYYKNNIKIYKNYDAVLSIGGGELSNLLIETVKKYSPNIKFVKFIWDTADLKYIQNIKKIYDKIYTFEKSDAEKYKINFRTSFFIDNEFVLWDKKNIDCYYLGAIRDNKRYNYVNKLYEYCKKNNLKSKLILYIKNKYRKLEHKNKNILTNKKLEYRDNIDFIKKSKVVLELNYSNQKGLTLRTLETIGGGNKLITNNKDIKNYDFYSSKNIHILYSENSIENIPVEFFKEPYCKLSDKIRQKYSFEGFLQEVLENED